MGTNIISIEEALNHAKQLLKEENWEHRSYEAAYTERCVSALKKQIAMQPKRRNATIGLCPECGNYINSEMYYCDRCGQKLDWS